MKVLGIIMVIALAVSAGCGGGGDDAASEIRSNTEQIYAAVKDDNLGKLCTYYTDRLACAASFATAKRLLGDIKIADLLTEKEFATTKDDVASMKVQMSQDGKTAWSRMKGDGDSDTWVLLDGEWKLEWEED